MDEDPIITGAIAGLFANIGKDLLNLISVLLNLTNHYYWHLAASVFIKPDQVKKVGGLVLGFLGDYIIAASFGVVLYYLLHFTGRRYFLLKGLGLSWMFWILLFGMFVNIDFIRITPTDIGTNLSAFITHSALGIGTGLLLKRTMRTPA